MFQIGDKVRVVKDELCCGATEGGFIGETGTIIDYSTVNKQYQVRLDRRTEFGYKFWFSSDEIEKIG